MKQHTYSLIVAKNLTPERYENLKDAIHYYFLWAKVPENDNPGIGYLRVFRHDGLALTHDDRVKLIYFVAGFASGAEWRKKTS